MDISQQLSLCIFRLRVRREQAVRAPRGGDVRGAEQLGGRWKRQPALEALHPQDRLQPAAPLQEDLRHHAGLV